MVIEWTRVQNRRGVAYSHREYSHVIINIPYGGEDDADDIVAGPNSEVSGLVVLSE
jgi:hypothetical protein